MTSDVEDINNSLMILLSTRPGERVMFPNYGCDLQEMLFKPLDLTLITQMKGIVERAILYHEPRINILSIEINAQDEIEGEILIEINYEVRNTNTRSNMVFPLQRRSYRNIMNYGMSVAILNTTKHYISIASEHRKININK